MTEPRKPRIDFSTVTPDAYTAELAFDRTVLAGSRKAGVDPALLHLLKIRASQLNGCAFCLDLHSRKARQEGESEQRLAVLSAWWNTPLFTERERAALALTEAVTSLPDRQVPDQ
ncbi:MAG TPA: carboxymuconolactone decarboxylase family protein, partial [Pseudonocardiaceae bacterium]|nr:carboxymuconolactone decarboxylase family protein [Pseudonocardiaceae bacterium]